jgi:hypothetical protein
MKAKAALDALVAEIGVDGWAASSSLGMSK